MTLAKRFPGTVFGPFSRRGTMPAQEVMHKVYSEKKNPELRFIAADVKGALKGYYLMTSRALQEVIKFNKANGLDNCFYELLPCSNCTYSSQTACTEKLRAFGCRAYLDIEFPANADWESFTTAATEKHEIGEEIADVFAQFLRERLKCSVKIYLLNSHRPGKYSWHAVFHTFRDDQPILFKECLCVQTIVREFFERGLTDPYVYHKELAEFNAVDFAVYTRHRLYRTLSSHKLGQQTGPLVWQNPRGASFADSHVLAKITEETVFFDVEPSRSTTVLKRKHELKESNGGQSRRQDKRAKMEYDPTGIIAIFQRLTLWKETFRFVLKKFPSLDMQKVQAKSFFRVYIPLDRNKMCPMKKGSGPDGAHKNNHSYLSFSPHKGCLYWMCQKRECRLSGSSKLIQLPVELFVRWKTLYSASHAIKYRLSS